MKTVLCILFLMCLTIVGVGIWIIFFSEEVPFLISLVIGSLFILSGLFLGGILYDDIDDESHKKK